MSQFEPHIGVNSGAAFKPRVESAKIERVIRIERVTGSGTAEDPVRKTVQFWTTRGVLIGEHGINDLHESGSAEELRMLYI